MRIDLTIRDKWTGQSDRVVIYDEDCSCTLMDLSCADIVDCEEMASLGPVNLVERIRSFFQKEVAVMKTTAESTSTVAEGILLDFSVTETPVALRR